MTLDKLLATLPNLPNPEPMSEATAAFLRKHNFPKELIATLGKCSYAGSIPVGRHRFDRVNDIPKVNAAARNRPCLRNGFLIVGAGLNGDPIALDRAKGTVAFISHDRLWEGSYDSFAECVAASPCGLDEFWTRAATDKTFPVDFYEAIGDV